MKTVYKKYLVYLYFIKKIYRKKNRENSINSFVLSVLLLILNLHSIAFFIEFLFGINLGLRDFWIPSETPKVVYGYIIGGGIAILLSSVIVFIERKITKVEKIKIIRTVIENGKSTRIISLGYLLGSIFLFILTTVWMIIIIIPKGGI